MKTFLRQRKVFRFVLVNLLSLLCKNDTIPMSINKTGGSAGAFL